jgi:hypothetical protein
MVSPSFVSWNGRTDYNPCLGLTKIATFKGMVQSFKECAKKRVAWLTLPEKDFSLLIAIG